VTHVDEQERLRRWRLILGAPSEQGLGIGLGTSDSAVDAAMAALYDTERTTELFCHIVNRWKSLGGWPLANPDETTDTEDEG
jgi:hypothetical protein